jgi:hypothetical protein
VIDHDEARARCSADLDGELGPTDAAELHAHLDGCEPCLAFADRLASVRAALRDDPGGAPDVRGRVLVAVGRTAAIQRALRQDPEPAPDVRARVRAELERSPSSTSTVVVERRGWGRAAPAARRWLPAAACLLVGLLIGSALVGGWRSPPPPAVAAQVPEKVAAAQFELTSLAAKLTVVERGWNPEVPERTFAGSIDFAAPESLALHLEDTTAYPSDQWVPNDVALVRSREQWWARGPRSCPSSAQPGCTAPEPRLEVVDRLAPFDDGVAVPLDLVVPVRSFSRAPDPPSLGERTIDGRDAVGVEVTASQVAPLLAGLRPAGNLRQFFASDPVALWLDARTWTPVRIEVRAADDPQRPTWAANRGYDDAPGDEILVVEVTDAVVNEGVYPQEFPEAPPGGVRRDAGFEWWLGSSADGSGVEGVVVDPALLPPGFVASTWGVVRSDEGRRTVVQTWFGGRGWVRVASTRDWDGDRLFGDLGSPVRRSDHPDGSVTYASLDGTRQAVHAGDLDVVVTGSLDADALTRVARGVGARGEPVPADWRDAATESVASAADLLPGLLVPGPGAWLADPAVRADGNVVTQAYAGAGGRGLVVVEAPGERLPPPLDLDVGGVSVRGHDGRYSATRGELEWVEGGRVHRLSSTTLTRTELLAVAEAMVPV